MDDYISIAQQTEKEVLELRKNSPPWMHLKTLVCKWGLCIWNIARNTGNFK